MHEKENNVEWKSDSQLQPHQERNATPVHAYCLVSKSGFSAEKNVQLWPSAVRVNLRSAGIPTHGLVWTFAMAVSIMSC